MQRYSILLENVNSGIKNMLIVVFFFEIIPGQVFKIWDLIIMKLSSCLFDTFKATVC